MLIGQYEYNHNRGSTPHRKVSFYETEMRTIEARVEGERDGQWQLISTLGEDKILVEGEKRAEALQRYNKLLQQGRVLDFTAAPNEQFSNLSIDAKKKLIQTLAPNGPYKLTIQYTFAERGSQFEGISLIHFSDSSS